MPDGNGYKYTDHVIESNERLARLEERSVRTHEDIGEIKDTLKGIAKNCPAKDLAGLRVAVASNAEEIDTLRAWMRRSAVGGGVASVAAAVLGIFIK